MLPQNAESSLSPEASSTVYKNSAFIFYFCDSSFELRKRDVEGIVDNSGLDELDFIPHIKSNIFRVFRNLTQLNELCLEKSL